MKHDQYCAKLMYLESEGLASECVSVVAVSLARGVAITIAGDLSMQRLQGFEPIIRSRHQLGDPKLSKGLTPGIPGFFL